jgi:hypothetical protein
MECSACEQPASPAEAAAAKRWRLAMAFALGLIVGAGIGTFAFFLPRGDLPGEALAAVWQEARPAGAFAAPAYATTRSDEPAEASPGLAGRQGEGQPRPAGLLALGEPVERSPAAAPAPATEGRRVWWNIPALGAAPFAVGSAR